MEFLKKAVLSAIFLSLAVFAASANAAQVAVVEDPEIAVPNKKPVENEGSMYFDRTPEEYRTAILNATNEAQIDAFICQQLVQEKREAGEDLSDYEFNDYLDSPEIKLERQRRAQEWMKEREKAKANATKPNLKKMIGILGAIVVVLLLVTALGGKRKQETETEEKKE
ncbi:MAG: hypothetical protein J6X44_06010 [Thermoguttaceae bacterium]|nr:hypothetical protein [Thermoguttaceae bacterium]